MKAGIQSLSAVDWFAMFTCRLDMYTNCVEAVGDDSQRANAFDCRRGDQADCDGE